MIGAESFQDIKQCQWRCFARARGSFDNGLNLAAVHSPIDAKSIEHTYVREKNHDNRYTCDTHREGCTQSLKTGLLLMRRQAELDLNEESDRTARPRIGTGVSVRCGVRTFVG